MPNEWRTRRWLAGLAGLASYAAIAAPSGIRLDVPYFRQEKNGCGSASIAMVMQYWGRQGARVKPEDADAARIQAALYSAPAKGVFASDIVEFFRKEGFRTFTFQADWSDLWQHVSKGRPLIVCLGAASSLHYVVVTGVDREPDLVTINDPAQRKLLKLDRRSFEEKWGKTGRWTLLALPAQE